MNTDIENIKTIEKKKNYIQNDGGQSTKVYNTIFYETDIFLDDFIKH